MDARYRFSCTIMALLMMPVALTAQYPVILRDRDPVVFVKGSPLKPARWGGRWYFGAGIRNQFLKVNRLPIIRNVESVDVFGERVINVTRTFSGITFLN